MTPPPEETWRSVHSSRTRFIARLLLLPVLSGQLGVSGRAFASVEQAAAAESFTFGEESAAHQAAASAPSRPSALNQRKAPVSASGAFTHSIPIDLPPGRLGMTPALAVSYSSSDFRNEGELGAGWNFGVRQITRSVKDGFPAVRDDGPEGPRYHEERAFFDGPFGRLAPTSDGPSMRRGALFVPIRETSPVRFEYIAAGSSSSGDGIESDSWIEHDPSGIKRFYGRYAGREGRLTNELGTHTWLLLEEVDPSGNRIRYEYHGAEEATRSDRRTPQSSPVLASVEWGANDAAGLPSIYRLETRVRETAGPVDLLHGHLISRYLIEKVAVYGPVTADRATNALYWEYSFHYRSSSETRRTLLERIERHAPKVLGSPPERTRTWTFTYSENPRGVRWDPTGQPLPESMKTVYVEGFVDERFASLANESWEARLDRAQHPRTLRGPVKLLDYDGNGREDAIYHPAGATVPNAHPLPELSFLQSEDGTWQSLAIAPHLDEMTASDLVDLDGDLDADAISFDVQYISDPQSFGAYVGATIAASSAGSGGDTDSTLDRFCTTVENSCCPDGGLSCGNGLRPPWGELECTGGRCPVRESWERFVYPEGRLSELTEIVERPVSPAPATTLSLPDNVFDVTALGGASMGLRTGALCGFGPDFCASALGGSFFSPCTDLRAACQLGGPVCSERCEAGNSSSEPRISGHTEDAWVTLNSSRGSGPFRYHVALSRWPTTAKQLVLLERNQGEALAAAGFPLPPGVHVGTGLPKVQTLAEHQTTFNDVNADGRADLVLLKHVRHGFKGAAHFRFLPRVYLNRHAFSAGGPTFALDEEDEAGARFTRSLMEILAHGELEACYAHGDTRPETSPCNRHIKYPLSENFNSLLSDVNADGLPDLVVAQPPSPIDADDRLCQPGHQVHLNLGYRFDSAGAAFPEEAWSAHPEDHSEGVRSHPLALLENFQAHRTLRAFGGAFCTFRSSEVMGELPLRSMAQTDVNADGRMDLVFRALVGGDRRRTTLESHVFLNDGRGFVSADLGQFHFPQVTLYPNPTRNSLTPQSVPFALSIELRSPQGLAAAQARNLLAVPDVGRMADFDGDGLVDLLVPGACTEIGPRDLMAVGADGRLTNRTCQPARWHRNLGEVPDLLVGIASSQGQVTEIDYVAAASSAANDLVRGLTRPAGRFVVREVRLRARPDQPQLQEAYRLRYENFVHHPDQREGIGFEWVEEELLEGGDEARPLSLTRIRYDVQRSLGASEIPFPLRGQVRSVSVRDFADPPSVSRRESEYALERRDRWVRIRPARLVSTTCLGDDCVQNIQTLEERDEHGFSKVSRSGDARNGELLHDRVLTTETTEYDHDVTRWILGLPKVSESIGFTQDLDGTERLDAVLRRTSAEYDERGRVTLRRRERLDAPGCDGAPRSFEEVIRYAAHGQPRRIERAGGETITLVHDALGLHVEEQSTEVTRHHDGEVLGRTTLRTHARFDYRFGVPSESIDLNGHTRSRKLDSFGRTLEELGPQGRRLAESEYRDEYPASVQQTHYTEGDRHFFVKTFHDGRGNTILGLKWSHTTDVTRTSFQRFDGLGRVVEAHPALRIAVDRPDEASLEELEPHPDTAQVTWTTFRYDAFDRLLERIEPDGARWQTVHKPRSVVETDPEGHRTERRTNAHGHLENVQIFDARGRVLAEHTAVVDGLGGVVELVDADGSIRRIERDGGGRIHRVTLPQKPESVGAAFTFCYDGRDQPIQAVSPAGRTVTTLRDELGRPRQIRGSLADAPDETVEVDLSYDDPEPGRNGLGRLTRRRDPSGLSEFGYDEFGRTRRFFFQPTEVLEEASDSPELRRARYEAELAYGNQGQLLGLEVSRTSGAGLTTSFGSYRYTRDEQGRLTGIDLAGERQALVSDLEYTPEDRVTTAVLGNGLVARWEYDPVTRLLEAISATGPSGAHRVTYEYNLDRNISWERVERTANFESVAGNHASHYTYDGLERLDGWSQTGTYGTRDETYRYSPAGNILSAGTTTYEYTSSASSQAASRVLARGRERELEYDADGFLVSDTALDAETHEHTTTSLRYDALGCLTQVERSGRRGLERSEHLCDGTARGVARRTTHHDSGRVERVIDFSGLAEIRPDDGPDGVFLLRLTLQDSTVVEEARSLQTGERLPQESGYLHKDIRGSVLARSTAIGDLEVTHEAIYEPWGDSSQLSEAPKPVHAFVDHEPDPGTGYYHFGARIYDPTLKRWLSPDPLLLAQPEIDFSRGNQLNLYAYAGNNPVVQVDPGGTIAWVVVAVVAVGLLSIKNDQDADISGVLGGAGDAVDAGISIAQYLDEPSRANLVGAVVATTMAAVPGDQPQVLTKFSKEISERLRHAPLPDSMPTVTSPCRGRCDLNSCFTAGTLVATGDDHTTIEAIQVGDRVRALDESACRKSSIEQGACRKIEVAFTDPHDAQGEVSVQLIRTADWVAERDLRVGGLLPLQLPELGLNGVARVKRLEACPPLESGPGCLVTMTVTHLNRTVLRLTFEGSDVTLEPTALHPLWSLDRGEWVRAGDLRVGERLRTVHGMVVVKSIDSLPGIHRVYNFEVDGAHTYLVSALDIDNHNPSKGACDGVISQPQGMTARAARREAMRREGIPTSQQPISQSRNASGHSYEYEVPAPGGKTEIKSVQQQTLDRSHPGQPHWEAGSVKLRDDGTPRVSKYGRTVLKNGKTKVNYDE